MESKLTKVGVANLHHNLQFDVAIIINYIVSLSYSIIALYIGDFEDVLKRAFDIGLQKVY